MANAVDNLLRHPIGPDGYEFHSRVAASTRIFEGTMVTQLTNGAGLVRATTASSGHVLGVAMHEADNSAGAVGDKRLKVETNRIYAFNNAGSNSVSEATPVGTLLYAVDDNTVATAGTTAAGYFVGMEPDGRVRVYISPAIALAMRGIGEPV